MAAKKTSTKAKKIVNEASKSITLNTIIFKDMVSRAKKGASNNSILPITSMMAIELKDNKLTLITTDATNYLYVMQDGVEGNDFYATVIADTFAQLIGKMTSEKITLELVDSTLKVTGGSGAYIIDLAMEEDGEVVRFTDPRDSVELEPLEDINLTTVNSIIDYAKASLAVTLEEPCFVNYYCGEKVVATDSLKICSMDVKLWEEPRLIPSEVFELVKLMTDEKIKVSAAGDIIMFSTSDVIVYAHTADGLEDYPADAIYNLVAKEFPANCKIKKSDLVQLLDRLSLFVDKMDKGIIYLTFSPEGLQIRSKKSNSIEVIPYIEGGDEEFSCAVDIGMLQNQAKSFGGDIITIDYGNNDADAEGNEVSTALKFVDGTTYFYIALVDDEEE